AWGICTVLTGVVEKPVLFSWLGIFPTLLVIRFLLGVFESPTYPAAGRSISRWIGPTGRAGANAIVIAGISLGSAITPPLLARLATAWGWRTALLLSAGPAFALAIVWLLYARDEPEFVVTAFMRSRASGDRMNPVTTNRLSTPASAPKLLTN